jgi:prolyl oligopeptidase
MEKTSPYRQFTQRLLIALTMVPFLVASGIRAATSAGDSESAPPATRTTHDVTHAGGTEVADPYRWLEKADSPEVTRWIAAQNAYAEKVLTNSSRVAAMSDRMQKLALTTVRRFAPKLNANRLFYLQLTPPQARLSLVVQDWPDGKPRVLIDPNTSKSGEAIANYWPSPNGKYLAVGISSAAENGVTIEIIDVRSGKEQGDRLTNQSTLAGTSLAWDADSKGLNYVRSSGPDSTDGHSFDAAVYHHILGQSPAKDSLSFSRGLSPMVNLSAPTAEYELIASPDGGRIAMLSRVGDADPAAVFVKKGAGWRRILDRTAGVRSASWIGRRLFVVAAGESSRGRLLAVDSSDAVAEIPVQGNSVVESVHPFAGGFLLTRVWGPDWKVEHYGPGDKFLRDVALPASGIGIDAIASMDDGQRALIAISGWTQPMRWVEYNAIDGAIRTVFEVQTAGDYSQIAAHRLDADSGAAIPVPITVLSKQGLQRNGNNPAILYAYGAYGIPVRPHFIGEDLAWLECGGVLAFANIRGGGEFGEDWHRDGVKLNKQHGADDFYAAARKLVADGWTDPQHLGIEGGSAGGIIIGMALTQHPGAYRAAVVQAGLYDLLRNETYPNGRYNIAEFGTVNDAEELRAMLSYSPLQRVRAATKYPAVMLVTAGNDKVVAPWQSRKFAAALQHDSVSGYPVLLVTRSGAELHDNPTFSQRVSSQAMTMGFFAGQLGMTECAKQSSAW